jgi:hypothetical protein
MVGRRAATNGLLLALRVQLRRKGIELRLRRRLIAQGDLGRVERAARIAHAFFDFFGPALDGVGAVGELRDP